MPGDQHPGIPLVQQRIGMILSLDLDDRTRKQIGQIDSTVDFGFGQTSIDGVAEIKMWLEQARKRPDAGPITMRVALLRFRHLTLMLLLMVPQLAGS